MKKVLNIIITYLLYVCIGLVLGAFFYSFYLNSLNYIAGKEIKFFSNVELLKSLFYVAYSLCFLICPLVCFYRIRHASGFSQTIAYIIICAITWIVFFPGVSLLNDFCERKISFKTGYESLSKGYFREVDDKVYYFTEDFDYKADLGLAAKTIIIDKSEDGIVTIKDIQDRASFALNKNAKPYREMQLKNIFKTDGAHMPITFRILVQKGLESFHGGFIRYLGFLSLALLLCSLYGLTNIFEWRLINSCVLFIGTVAALFFNSVFYLPVCEGLRNRFGHNKLFDFLSNYINEPLLVVINIIFTLAILVLGIIKFAVHKHGKKDR